MTSTLDYSVSPAQADRAEPATGLRCTRWFWLSVAAIGIAQALKFPAVHAFVLSNLDKAPDTSGLPADMLDTALSVGTGAGLLLGFFISVLGLTLIRALSRNTPQITAKRHLFPGWLLGLGVVGLVVPDLLTAATGTIYPFASWTFALVYPLVALASVWASPAPQRPARRVVDLGLFFALPFV